MVVLLFTNKTYEGFYQISKSNNYLLNDSALEILTTLLQRQSIKILLHRQCIAPPEYQKIIAPPNFLKFLKLSQRSKQFCRQIELYRSSRANKTFRYSALLQIETLKQPRIEKRKSSIVMQVFVTFPDTKDFIDETLEELCVRENTYR